MPTSNDRELTRDEALLALNDVLGDEVVWPETLRSVRLV